MSDCYYLLVTQASAILIDFLLLYRLVLETINFRQANDEISFSFIKHLLCLPLIISENKSFEKRLNNFGRILGLNY